MLTRLKFSVGQIFNSFWFVPSSLIVASFFMAALMLWVDNNVGLPDKEWSNFVFAATPDGARATLSAISGSMITVAGVILSTTVVVLTLASQQFGPRLLKNFIEDRVSQFVMGSFAACFIYSVLILRNTRSGDYVFVPHFSVLMAVILAVASICLMIYFVHHVSIEIRVQAIMSRVYSQLRDKIDALFPQAIGDSQQEVSGTPDDSPKTEASEKLEVRSHRPGYLQSLDDDSLLELTVDEDIVIDINFRPGQFIFEKDLIGTIRYIAADNSEGVINPKTLALNPPSRTKRDKDALTSAVLNAIVIGRFPTSEQDVQFPINQLEEIAIRALSPGINDPHTALECIDYLASAMCTLADRTFPSDKRYDDEGTLRIVATGFTYERLLTAAFRRIHFYGKQNPDIITHLLQVLGKILEATPEGSDRRELVIETASTYFKDSKALMKSEHDIEQIEHAYRVALKPTLLNI